MVDDLLVVLFLQSCGEQVALRVGIAAQVKQEALRRRIVGGVQPAAVVHEQAVDGTLVRGEKKLAALVGLKFCLGFDEQGMPKERISTDGPVAQQVIQ